MNTVPYSIHSPWLKHKTQATKALNPGTEHARDPANRDFQNEIRTIPERYQKSSQPDQTSQQDHRGPKTTQNQGLRKPYSYKNHRSQISASDLRGSQQEPYEQKAQANPTAVQAPPSNVYKRQIPEANRIENKSSTTTSYTHM
ncbi:hypothetical protein PHYBLDRAFT_73240 [Phycomyces blakesleeanus NRRL 1555(-)]|uniref:Uncharacterized protein n=1 Tax=Phycomyces blakesleeanus (strain ATCC 8743b / DSM 1359 / FGSC 10004 / NBRC 33097 / NRRL 1555) TaxID=763407 RepID=A0A162N5F7_PHYB8|nr:hypothetical protein PHYBLDRAFT_73240 [Phycomyces blakesleeanus NRRL 1555(-)]OAD65984.1 hypothetical protein PHYBLDRAFT_73240 [Phycomyces blakesleeanus NRRL 1555(-)]|eukprot:XP_018284024.1 hypothetical protein PHYBLDRAFT_73240 [Phycomyces blakesleeanus NRRL 1555(-)]